MTLFLTLATRLRLPPRLLAGILVVLLIGGAWIGLRAWLGARDADAVASHESAVQLELQTRGRAADQALGARRATDDAAIRNQRKEFDNATTYLPPSGLSARQRFDACEQLRAQGEPAAVLARAGCV